MRAIFPAYKLNNMTNVVEVLEAHRNFGVPGEGMKAISLDDISGKQRPVALVAPSYLMVLKLKIREWLKFPARNAR